MATSPAHTHEVRDFRPLRRLALAAGAELLAAVTVVIARKAAVLATRTWVWLPAAWFAGAIAALLLNGAVTASGATVIQPCLDGKLQRRGHSERAKKLLDIVGTSACRSPSVCHGL